MRNITTADKAHGRNPWLNGEVMRFNTVMNLTRMVRGWTVTGSNPSYHHNSRPFYAQTTLS